MDDLSSHLLLDACELNPYITIMVLMRLISRFLTPSYVSIFNILIQVQVRLVTLSLTSIQVNFIIYKLLVTSLLALSYSMLFGRLIPFFIKVITYSMYYYIHSSFGQGMLGLLPMIGIPLVMNSLRYIGQVSLGITQSLANFYIKFWK